MYLKKASVLIVLCILAMILCSCYSALPETTQESTSAPESTTSESTADINADVEISFPVAEAAHTFSGDNLWAAYAIDRGIFPVEDGYYRANSQIRYYDIASQTDFVMCNRAGCSHITEDCPAYIPYVSQLLASEKGVYVFTSHDGSLSLVKLDIQTYEKSTEFTMTARDGISYGMNNSFYSSGKIFFRFTKMDSEGTSESTWVYDEETGETSLLFANTELEFFTVDGAYDSTVLVYRSQYDEAVLEWEEYLELHSIVIDEATNEYLDELTDEYHNYIYEFREEHCTTGLYFYDMEEMTYTDAYPLLRGDSQEIPNTNYSSNSACFGEYVLYKLGNAVMRYSMATGERELLVEEEGITNGNLLDGKLIYLTRRDENLEVWVYDIASGEKFSVDNAGNNLCMSFGIYGETKDAFFGYDSYGGSGESWILKEDFYNARYENAHK